jgi:hypothetical protein
MERWYLRRCTRLEILFRALLHICFFPQARTSSVELIKQSAVSILQQQRRDGQTVGARDRILGLWWCWWVEECEGCWDGVGRILAAWLH